MDNRKEMSPCPAILQHLDDYLDQELPFEAMLPILEHLRACVACAELSRTRYDALAQVREILQRLAPTIEFMSHRAGQTAETAGLPSWNAEEEKP